jgi:hypothetical protein
MKKLFLFIYFGALAATGVANVKNLPYGIFFLPAVSTSSNYDDPNPNNNPDWNLGAWNNPNVIGVVARISWEYLEPHEGQFVFDPTSPYYQANNYLDTIEQYAHQYGKLWEIEIVCGSDGPDNDTPFYPSWVKGDGAQTHMIHDDNGLGFTICIPWDPIFQAKWHALINAVAAKYDGIGLLRTVWMTGVGRDAECFFCSNNRAQNYYGDWDWLYAQGGGKSVADAEALWEDAAKTIAGFYATAFVHTPFHYATGHPLPDYYDPGTGTTGNATMAAVVSYLNSTYNSGHPWRFGTKSCGYTGSGPADPWGARYGIFFQGYQQRVPVGTGAALEAENAYVSPYNGIWFEVYKPDCLISSNYSAFDDFNTHTAAEVGTNTYQ